MRCVSVANEYIGGVRTVGSGLQSFFFLVCVDFLSRQLDVLLTGFVVDGIPYVYINMYLQAYVWCVSVDNEYIGGVRAVGSGLRSFFCVCMLIFYLDSWLCYLTGFVVDGIPYAYINMCLRAYIWCVFVTNEYIMQVCAVGSGLQSFVCFCVLIFYLDS